ncbi:MAG: ATP-binding protein, partial [Chloroflexota bacterium]
LLIGLILGGWGLTTDSTAIWATLGVAGSVVFGAALSIVLGLTGGLAVSVAFGLVAGVLVSLAFGLASLALNGDGRVFALLVALSLADGVAGSVIFGVARAAPGGQAGHSPAYSSTRQLGGIVVGILIAFGLVVSIVAGRGGLNMARPLIFGVIGGIAVGVALGWRTAVRRGLVIGLGFGLLVSGLRLIGVIAASPDLNNLANAALLVALFALSYTLAERIAGPWAGAVAGAFSSGSILLSGFFGVDFNLLCLGVACILLGLTAAWWRPVLLYPFLAAWNFLLYRADERRTGLQASLLRRHSAFWDEYQLLPLPGLVEHLVLVAERQPAEGQAALDYLTTGRQRWAAQAAQIELEARRLEHDADIEAIGQAHRRLAAGELAGPASALLRSFSRISQDVAAALNQASGYNRRLALSAVEERLDGLLRELMRSSEHYALRFQPIATRWRQVVADYIQVLTEAVELRQEIDSPYIIGLPLTDQQEIFVGRTDISARIEQLLLDRR